MDSGRGSTVSRRSSKDSRRSSKDSDDDSSLSETEIRELLALSEEKKPDFPSVFTLIDYRTKEQNDRVGPGHFTNTSVFRYGILFIILVCSAMLAIEVDYAEYIEENPRYW